MHLRRDHHGRSSCAFKPAALADVALFAAVLRGEFYTLHLYGFRNRAVRMQLFGSTAATDRRRSGKVSRLMKRLHVRRLVAEDPTPAAGGSPSSGMPSSIPRSSFARRTSPPIP